MARLWRILVLVLAVMPLAMPAICRSAALNCKAQMAIDHPCCARPAAVTAPSCCNAKADTALAGARNAAQEDRVIAGSPAFPPATRVEPDEAEPLHEPQSASIPIHLPRLILRT